MRSRSVLFMSCILLLAGTTTSIAATLDLPLLKRNAQIFEGIVNEVVKQNFPNPLAMTEGAKASYLQEYGIAVSLHLNINRANLRTPFGLVQTEKEDRSKEEQLQILKNSMVRCLEDYGGTFKQLPGGHFVALALHVEDRNELDPSRNTTIVIISASKENVDFVTMGKISSEQFEERVRITEY
ncbi:MAG: hypothetical protein VYA53_02345 [Acidobacteriota bacterium]|nr:hypothetical protein [Acidobacteriota bacterium]